MPEDILVGWSLHFPRSATATGTPRKPCSVQTILLCIAVCARYSGVARIFCGGVLFTSKWNVLILYHVGVFQMFSELKWAKCASIL